MSHRGRGLPKRRVLPKRRTRNSCRSEPGTAPGTRLTACSRGQWPNRRGNARKERWWARAYRTANFSVGGVNLGYGHSLNTALKRSLLGLWPYALPYQLLSALSLRRASRIRPTLPVGSPHSQPMLVALASLLSNRRRWTQDPLDTDANFKLV